MNDKNKTGTGERDTGRSDRGRDLNEDRQDRRDYSKKDTRIVDTHKPPPPPSKDKDSSE